MPVPRAIERAAASAQARDEALSAKHNYFTNRTRRLSLLWYALRVPLLPLFVLRLLTLVFTLLYMLLIMMRCILHQSGLGVSLVLSHSLAPLWPLAS